MSSKYWLYAFSMSFSLILFAGIELVSPLPIGVTAYARKNGCYFVGAATASTGEQAGNALAVITSKESPLMGITPETVTIDGQPQTNPLWGAPIQLLTATGRRGVELDSLPAALIATDPQYVYVTTAYGQQETVVVKSTPLLDAFGNPAHGLALAGSQPGPLYACTFPEGGTFGDRGSCLNCAELTNTGTQQHLMFRGVQDLDRTTSFLTTGSPLTVLDQPKLYVSYFLGQLDIYVGTLFAGFHAIAGPTETDGAIAVAASDSVVGDPAIRLRTIVDQAAVTQDSIIAARGPLAEVSVHQFATLFPSVGGQYLIVVGGVGAINKDPLNVYALPLTRSGYLANVNAQLYDQYAGKYFLSRDFNEPARSPGDLYSSANVQAHVGAGSSPGKITSLYTVGDTVFISVADGIFYSQALFDHQQKISGWTVWQRAVATQKEPNNVVYDRTQGHFFYTVANDTLETHTVVCTMWQENGTPLAQQLHELFPSTRGGIQHVRDVPARTPLFSQEPQTQVSAALVAGLQSVVLAQTVGDPVIVNFAHDLFGSMGAIVASAIVSDGTQSWITVGGNGGLLVLAYPDGRGIPNGSIGSGLAGFAPELIWRRIGDYRHVRKLVAQNGRLYILTDKLLERVIITPGAISNKDLFNAVNLATAGAIPDQLALFFSDIIISEPLILLATSSGLLRNSNSSEWVPVALPESPGAVTRLWAVTQTQSDTDLYRAPPGVCGNLYVLAGNVSLDQARVYRFAVSYTGDTLQEKTLTLFNDCFLKDRPTFFVNMGSYRNYFYTDGALWTASRSRYVAQKAFVQTMPVTLKSGVKVRLPATGSLALSGNSVGQLQRLSGTGSWVIPGDFGLVVHH